MIFKTLVKADHKLGGNKYVLGRISGIKYVVCDTLGLSEMDQVISGNGQTEAGHILKTECTAECYSAFTDIIESHYPGLCVFDYTD